MTETKRRKPQPKAQSAPEATKAPRKRLDNKLDDYRKAETPYGTVHYKRPFDGPRQGFRKKPRKFGAPGPKGRPQARQDGGHRPPLSPRKPWGNKGRQGTGYGTGKHHGPGGPKAGGGKSGWQHKDKPAPRLSFPELDIALDRELPLTLERLSESEKLLTDSAAKILDLTERLQSAFPEIGKRMSELGLDEAQGEAVKGVLADFGKGFSETLTQLFEAAAFDDLCGQRLRKVEETVGTVTRILINIKKATEDAQPGKPGRPGKPQHGPVAGSIAPPAKGKPGKTPYKADGPKDAPAPAKPPKTEAEKALKKAVKKAAKKAAKKAIRKHAGAQGDPAQAGMPAAKDKAEKGKAEKGKAEKAAKKANPANAANTPKGKAGGPENLQGPTIGGLSQDEIERLFENERGKDKG
ncbi:MAG: hypothetical protein LBF40_03135 [Deltaproteobacteria bacterium]|jgi:hypothetical protein|nr:hypothetical protein [Deltaproteobacteria bacterium]